MKTFLCQVSCYEIILLVTATIPYTSMKLIVLSLFLSVCYMSGMCNSLRSLGFQWSLIHPFMVAKIGRGLSLLFARE